MNYEMLILEKKDRMAILKLNRPNALNALNSQILLELDKAIDNIKEDDSVDVLILTGEGKAFVAGADISQMKDLNAEEGRKFGLLGQRVFRKIETLEKPSIAAVNGFALGGGCELAMSCDLRIASERAKFGQPEVGLGITPGFSGTQRLPRLVGVAKAKELIFTGNIIKAEEARDIGLVNKVVDKESLLDEAISMAQSIIKNAQLAVRYSKMAIDRGMQGDIDTGIEVEANLFGLCFATKDQKEGMTAFVEKREANFETK
ncbi:MAG: short-chain-enoyl-CoA hydratase [Anaeromicrobium sp.]|jgi:enoyl-CoA hydratase|uniref:short-chain-enoyl-CoA hydratase n=1 Tax=Anaeromicrobium sp. TaxID=1929132 RepID=UPI0025F0B920|nr:short-chain-enoyl-CoA hydratase [Anaeromicrobium sp.]MCT4594031.1 short-chain-enoyl-CoA hydratase [Anaeromicrobium sp.]